MCLQRKGNYFYYKHVTTFQNYLLGHNLDSSYSTIFVFPFNMNMKLYKYDCNNNEIK